MLVWNMAASLEVNLPCMETNRLIMNKHKVWLLNCWKWDIFMYVLIYF